MIRLEPKDLCMLCARAPHRRRKLCWSCYRKFRETGQITAGDGELTLFNLVLIALMRMNDTDLERVREALK